MVKMRCLRAHSSIVWGSPSEGEIFEVAEGYVKSLVDAGLAERVGKPTIDEVTRELEATVPVQFTRGRGRPRK